MPNAAPTSSAGTRARQAQLLDDEDAVAVPEHGRQDVARARIGKSPTAHRRQEAPNAATSASATATPTTRGAAAARGAGDATATAVGRSRRRWLDARRHSSARFRRRTSQTKNGAPRRR